MTDLEMDLLIAQARIKQLEKELANKIPTVKEAIATIMAHCIMHPGCEGCCLLDQKSEYCFFSLNGLPDEWIFGGEINGH